MSGIARVLCIDGGGIRGIVPALLLQHIEEELNRPISGLFHMIAGTSTGGIIALGLSKPGTGGGPGLEAADLVALYRDRGGEIFSRSLWKGFSSLGGLTDEKYGHENLEAILEERLGDTELSEARCQVLVTAYDLERRSPHFFKSWRAQGHFLETHGNTPETKNQRDFRMRDAARATSAAPTFFEPALVWNRESRTQFANRDQEEWDRRKAYALVDGGVFANNPVMCALASARKIYPDADGFLVVSLGTGELERPIPYEDAKDWGLVGWVRPVLNVIMDGVEDTVHYQIKDILGDGYYRFQVDLGKVASGEEGPNDDMDDASRTNIAKLSEKADELMRKKAVELAELCTNLDEPLADRQYLGFPPA